MGRKKKNNYNRTPFAIRIEELQNDERNRYTNEYVLEHLVDENNNPIINDPQVLDSYKSGKRKPRDFDDVLKAFARFYDVTTDYLLGATDTPKPQIKSVQDVTGLSEASVRRLIQFQDKHPELLAMVDAIIAGTSEDDLSSYLTLYNQIYQDYKDSKTDPVSAELHTEMNKMQKRYFLTQALYNCWQRSVTTKLSERFDKEMLIEQDLHQYENSQEYLDSIPNQEPYEVTATVASATPVATPIGDDK